MVEDGSAAEWDGEGVWTVGAGWRRWWDGESCLYQEEEEEEEEEEAEAEAEAEFTCERKRRSVFSQGGVGA